MSMEDNETEIELRIHGMDCAEEVTLLKRELIPLLGDEDRLGFDLLNGKLTVDTSSLDVTHLDVLAAIQRTGLKSEPWQDVGAANDDQSFWQQHQRSILTTVSGLFGLSADTYFELLPLFAESVETGKGTRERNFLPFVAWLKGRASVVTYEAPEPESVGVNTVEEAEQFLRLWQNRI